MPNTNPMPQNTMLTQGKTKGKRLVHWCPHRTSASPVSCLLTLPRVLMKRGSGRISARIGPGSFSFSVYQTSGTLLRVNWYSGVSELVVSKLVRTKA